MAKSIVEVDVFIGACGDVEDDVDAIKDAISEYNNTSNYVKFSPKYWKDSAYSSMGNQHAQYEINKQLLRVSDVFIFVVHSRIGTIVDGGETGIEKEFKYAINKKKSSENCFVQLYEKCASFPHDVDVQQLSRLKNFVDLVSKNDGLKMPYKDKGELQERVRYSLSRFSDSFKNNSNKNEIEESPAFKEDDDLGFLDYLEQIETKFQNATQYILNYTKCQSIFSDQINSFSKNMKYVSLDMMGASEKKKKVDIASAYFEEFSHKVEPGFPEFRSNLLEGMIAAIGVIHEARENGGTTSELRGFLDVVASTRESIAYCLDEQSKMAASFEKIPRLTSRMKKVSRRLDKLFSDYNSTLIRAVSLADEVLQTGRSL